MYQDDFLAEILAERTKANPDFPTLVDVKLRERRLLRALAAQRAELGLSQTEVAARMRTSQSASARLEGGGLDAKLSTIERYAAAVGKSVEWRLEDAANAQTGKTPDRAYLAPTDRP